MSLIVLLENLQSADSDISQGVSKSMHNTR